MIFSAYRSQTAPTSYAYSLRCGINTAIKRIYSNIFDNSTNPPARWGSLFSTPDLLKCMKAINDKHHDVAKIIDSTAICVENSCNFDRLNAIPTLVDGIMGYHMTIFYIVKLDEGLHVEFFDGKALPLNHPLNSRAQFVYDQFKKRVISFKQLSKPVQFDAHNCGPLAAWFFEKRLEGNSFEAIAAMPSPDIESYRSALVLK